MNGVRSGDWQIDALKGLDHVVITLKAGNGFGAFLLDLTGGAPLTGTWAATKDLSHASIYYNGEVAPIPLPAAAWMFLTGLAGFFGWRRRNRKQAAVTG
ncbi:MAG: VPLPA-CTERM sorting domain-containing protein, partial [Pseudomonadota bacterium]